MHVEYKTPAGKLVVVDFGVEDGNMSNVVVSGDFFLEPPEALADIVRALEGAPADLGGEGLAGRIRETRDEGVEMVGFSANRYWDACRELRGAGRRQPGTGRHHDRRARRTRGPRAQHLRNGGLDLLDSLKLSAVSFQQEQVVES
ncbi:MAG TPA: hypothetical protein VFY59_04525 [Rubrobacter sp.]|nr:hypothetical protein [Rubrobacter sp.]